MRAIDHPVINELLYNPIGNDIENEFVEIYNPTNSVIDLDGWGLTDNDGALPDIIFDNLGLPPNSFLVISTGDGNNDTDLSDGLGHIYLDQEQGIWTNTGDDVLLFNNNGDPVDYLAYGNGEYVDLPPAGAVWTGKVDQVPEGYSLGRMPDGNDTDRSDDFRALLPTLGTPNAFDGPPVILEFDYSPKQPEEFSQLDISARITDQVRVEKSYVHVLNFDATQFDALMSYDNSDDKYHAKIAGVQRGMNLTISILAFDPLGQKATSDTVNVTFVLNVSAELDVVISPQTAAVQPGEYFKIVGSAHWSNGSKASGTVTAENPKTMGIWVSEFMDFFNLRVQAPTIPGSYDLTVIVEAGTAKVLTKTNFLVQWPSKTVNIVLNAKSVDGTELHTCQNIVIEGSAKFNDGLPVKNTSVGLEIMGTNMNIKTRTDPSGGFLALMSSPSVDGNYQLQAVVMAIGSQFVKTIVLTIQDHILLDVEEIVQMPLDRGENFTVVGHASHHDRRDARNIMIIIEILNTTHKAKAFTDDNGDFTVNVTAPFYKGEYNLRVTAISGNAISAHSSILYVRGGSEGEERTPGFDTPVLIISVLTWVFAAGRSLRHR